MTKKKWIPMAIIGSAVAALTGRWIRKKRQEPVDERTAPYER